MEYEGPSGLVLTGYDDQSLRRYCRPERCLYIKLKNART